MGTIYPNQRKMYRDRQEIPLTTKENELLCLLATNQGQVLTYTQIYEKVWGGSPAANTISTKNKFSLKVL